MARFARRLGWTLAVLIGGLVAATLLTARWGDRSLYPVPPGTQAVAIFLVSHGWHSGIALPCEVMADVAGRRGNRDRLQISADSCRSVVPLVLPLSPAGEAAGRGEGKKGPPSSVRSTAA